MKTTTETTTTRKTTTALGYEDVREAFDLPEGTRIYIRVPGGGDYSNCDLEIGSDVPLFTETITTEES